MEVKRLRIVLVEIFKTINNMDPKFVKSNFKPMSNAKIRPFDMIYNTRKDTKFAIKFY